MILSKKALAALSLATTLILPNAYAIDNGVYTIKSKYSAKFLEVASAQTNDGANVSQWADTNHDTQRWLITNIGGSNYSVINLNSGKALEVFDFSTPARKPTMVRMLVSGLTLITTPSAG